MTTTNPVPDCSICAWADRTGSWVDAPGHKDLTHCRQCHGSWPRQTEYQHCMGCCQTFTTASIADMHRDRTGACNLASGVTDRKGHSRLRVTTRKMDPRTSVSIWTTAAQDPRWARST